MSLDSFPPSPPNKNPSRTPWKFCCFLRVLYPQALGRYSPRHHFIHLPQAFPKINGSQGTRVCHSRGYNLRSSGAPRWTRKQHLLLDDDDDDYHYYYPAPSKGCQMVPKGVSIHHPLELNWHPFEGPGLLLLLSSFSLQAPGLSHITRRKVTSPNGIARWRKVTSHGGKSHHFATIPMAQRHSTENRKVTKSSRDIAHSEIFVDFRKIFKTLWAHKLMTKAQRMHMKVQKQRKYCAQQQNMMHELPPDMKKIIKILWSHKLMMKAQRMQMKLQKQRKYCAQQQK